MATLDDVQAAIDSLNKVVSELSTPAEPSLGDKVLEAVLPVLEAAGYTAPAPTTQVDVQQG